MKVSFAVSDQQMIQRAVFALINEDEARKLNETVARDEDDGYDEDDLNETWGEFAQEKLDNAVNAGKLPEPFDNIIQVLLECIDWSNHPNWPN